MSLAKQDPQAHYVRGGTQQEVYERESTVEWPCPLCGSTDAKTIKVERGVLQVVECSSCKLIRVNPRLKEPEAIYQGNQAIYAEEFRMVLSGKQHHRDPVYLRDLARIERHKPNGNFLDVGTNTGSFLRLARDRGWTLTGVEPSPQLGELGRRWWGLDIIQGFVEKLDLPKHHYDVVTMTDVFEHVVNPKEVLRALRHVIKDDGLLFVKVPNARFNILKFKARSAMGRTNQDDFDSYEHVVHYTDETLAKMLRSSGFEPFDIFIEPPIQLPSWHRLVGHYYQHTSPFLLDWKTQAARETLYRLAFVEKLVARRVGWLGPNIGALARPLPQSGQ